MQTTTSTMLVSLLVGLLSCDSNDDPNPVVTPDTGKIADVVQDPGAGDSAVVDDPGVDEWQGTGAEIGIDDCPMVTDVPPADLGPELTEVKVGNGLDDCENVLLKPDPGEEGAWALARLTPPGYPFTVTRVRYRLGQGKAGNVTCDASLEHRVRLFASADTVPSAEPTLLAELVAPAMAPEDISDEGRAIGLELDEPVLVEEGEHLFMAVELLGAHPNVMCTYVDTASTAGADRSYWSTAQGPPYSWVQINEFGLVGAILYFAFGYVPAG